MPEPAPKARCNGCGFAAVGDDFDGSASAYSDLRCPQCGTTGLSRRKVMPDQLAWLPAAPAWSPTNAQYHANRHWWGSTMLKVFRESPGLAWHRFIKGDLEIDSASPALVLGSLVHILLLEPDVYGDEVIVVDAQSKVAKLYKTMAAANPDKLVVTKPEHLRAKAMAGAVLYPQTEGARIAHHLLFGWPGVAEYSYRWKDAAGVPCKVRFDLLCQTKRGPTRVNLKTTRATTLGAYQRQAFDLGYHAQEAFYERGLRHLAPDAVSDSLEVVIHNAEPFEVAVLQPSAEFLELGRRQIKSDLSTLGEALQTPDRGCWASAWESGIGLLQLPPWARLKSSRSVVDTF